MTTLFPVVMEFIFWISVIIVGYVYFGYPLLLSFLSGIMSAKKATRRGDDSTGGGTNPSHLNPPNVTLIISAYNEEQVIGKKLINALALDYPKDLLEILVVSDCSMDGTDAIVESFADQGVRLLRLNERHGKTYGLNKAVQAARGEILVFSDANAMYEPSAVRKLVRHFADPNVGYVVGEARYIKDGSSASSNEDFYWKYEQFLKRRESNTGSVVGGDGALYAIRKALYEPLQRTDINDFVNPLQIVAKGYRGIYDPEAVCWEDAAGTYAGEFRRKIRIVNRSLRGLWRVKQVLNPFKFAIFSWKVISHKLIRWFVPVLLITAFLSNLALVISGSIEQQGKFEVELYTLLFAIQVLFYLLALLGILLVVVNKRQLKVINRFLSIPYYFCLVNLASLIGIFKTLRGEVTVTWNPERVEERKTRHGNKGIGRKGRREEPVPSLQKEQSLSETKERKEGKERRRKEGRRQENCYTHYASRLMIYALAGAYVTILVTGLMFDIVAHYVFWGAVGLIVYSNVGYPLVLACATVLRKREVKKCSIFPTVSLVVAAYNEKAVIEDKIKNSLSLDYPQDKLEIVVGSDGSSDGTAEIIKAYDGSGIRAYCFEERSGKTGVLNKILPHIQSEIVVFSDANTMYEPLAIQKLVRNFCDPDVGVVSGQVILENKHVSFGKSERMYYHYERYLQGRESRLESMLGADGAMYAIRRSLFKMPPDDTILDDFVIAMGAVTAGYRIIYEPEAIAYEDTVPNLKSEFNRKSRIVAGAIQMMMRGLGIPTAKQGLLWFQFLSHKLLRWVTPWLLVALFLTNLRLVVREPHSLAVTEPHITIYSVIAFSQIGFYLLGLCGIFFNRVSVTAVPQYLCTMYAAFGFGGIKGLTNRQRVTWKTSR